MNLASITWTLTALAAVVVVITRVRLRANAEQSGVSAVAPSVVHAHALVGLAAIVTWSWWLLSSTQALGYVAVVLWWIVALIGLLVLARWLPSRGHHSTQATNDALARGPVLSIIGHGGMLLCVVFFTWIFFAGKP